jgi:hypothetical protein
MFIVITLYAVYYAIKVRTVERLDLKKIKKKKRILLQIEKDNN